MRVGKAVKAGYEVTAEAVTEGYEAVIRRWMAIVWTHPTRQRQMP